MYFIPVTNGPVEQMPHATHPLTAYYPEFDARFLLLLFCCSYFIAYAFHRGMVSPNSAA